jgi:hypothetical protein
MQQKTKMMIILILYKKDVSCTCTDLLNLRTMKYDTQISILYAKKIILFF